MRFLRTVTTPLAWLAIGLVMIYRATLSKTLPRSCRFTPSCSSYMIEAIRKKGFLVGVSKGIWRILRCNPFCEGGYDPVDPDEERPPSAAGPAPSDASEAPSADNT